MKYNPILNTDSYKASHYLQYPPKTEYVYSYVEARKNPFQCHNGIGLDFNPIFFGLQGFLKRYLSVPVTTEDIDQAERFLRAHNLPFNRDGWEYIVKQHRGYLPLEIRAVREGSRVPHHNALVTIINTDPNCYWLPSYVETALLRDVWYGSTVATNSAFSKAIIAKHLNKTTGDLTPLEFMLHDFGARGVSSFESAQIGGAAHLINFQGTDTISGILYAQEYYNETEMLGFSIPAAEHSSITSWGPDGEVDAYRNMLTQFTGKDATYGAVAIVSDSYDIYQAVDHIWGETLKQDVIDSNSLVVIRPDSGDPVEVVSKVITLLDNRYGSKLNLKGFKILNNVKVIQGDGIDSTMIDKILENITDMGYAASNMVFGQGGGLLQQVNRDTLAFAYKASWISVDGKGRDVFKKPKTDGNKASKKGRVQLYTDGNHNYTTSIETPTQWSDKRWQSAMELVFLNGHVLNEVTFSEIRKRANWMYS